MDDAHLSRQVLFRALTGEAAQHESDFALSHLRSCKPCQELAAGVVEELRERGALKLPSKLWTALLALLEDDQRQAIEKLRAEGWWTELSELAPEQQREQVKAVLSLQTPEFFEAVLSEASLIGSTDPHVGEETALTARAVADLLRCPHYPQELKNDLAGRAMVEMGNCHRLAANWPGSQSALHEAGRLLELGTRDPKLEARLLSVSASLASDTGDFEAAQRLLGQAAERYRASGDAAGLASIAVQEANILLAGCRFEQAMSRAKEALSDLSPSDLRLEMLARDTITECLIELKRPAQALFSFLATRPLYEKLWGRRNQLRLAYKRSRLLDAFGCFREADKAYQGVIRGHVEEGLYKSALNISLTFFESLLKRGAVGKAIRVCEEASRLLNTPLCHPQMKEIWAELLAQVRSQALSASRILEVRLYILRHWSVPAARQPFAAESLAPVSAPLVLAELAAAAPAGGEIPSARPSEEQAQPSSSPSLFADESYLEKMARRDRELIAAALTETGGGIRATARLLGISRNFLRTKIKKYRLETLVNDGPQAKDSRARSSRRSRSPY